VLAKIGGVLPEPSPQGVLPFWRARGVQVFISLFKNNHWQAKGKMGCILYFLGSNTVFYNLRRLIVIYLDQGGRLKKGPQDLTGKRS
jgi:hypothetical protein